MNLAATYIFFTMAVVGAIGLNIAFWSFIGCLRLIEAVVFPKHGNTPARFSIGDVAVVIPAYNEENSLPSCLAAATRVVSASQIFVANDSSTDRTRRVAALLGCNVYTAKKNLGKARILDATISHFDLCYRFGVVLILDADSELDSAYLERGLRLFDHPDVAVVAGHVVSRTPVEGRLTSHLINAYRSRLYAIVQAFIKYGQTWHCANVTYIAPGFASMYRTDVLKQINIVAPGLVIEDFNMTFEVHRRQLGKVAYSPAVKCSTEDPATLLDYSRQVRRWYLGFWQTIGKQGIWAGKFWMALAPVVLESFISALFILALPILLIWSFADYSFDNPLPGLWNGSITFSPELGIVIFLMADFLMSCLAAVILWRPLLIVYGLCFPFIRAIDALWFTMTLWQAFKVNSDGRWKSPERVVRT